LTYIELGECRMGERHLQKQNRQNDVRDKYFIVIIIGVLG